MPVGNYSGKQYSYYSLAKDIVERQGQIFHKQSNKFYGFIKGYLVGIEKSDVTFKDGKEAFKIKFKLAGRNLQEIDVLECGRYTFFTRDVLNRLMSLDEIGWVKLTPYTSTDDKGKNYIRGSVKHSLEFTTNIDDESCKLKFAYESKDIPEVEYVKVGKNTTADTLKRDDFFDNLIIVLNSKLKHNLDAISRTEEEEPSEADEIAF